MSNYASVEKQSTELNQNENYFSIPAQEQESTIPRENFSPKMEEMLAALNEAGEGTRSWLYSRSLGLKGNNVYFVPNLDGCYSLWAGENTSKVSTLGSHASHYGAESKTALENQEANAKSHGITKLNPYEANFIYMVNYNARMDAGETNQKIMVAKHFPGGDRHLELTEKKELNYGDSLSEMMSPTGHLAPFIRAINSEKSPPAMMMGHALYSNAELELREMHPKINSIPTGGMPLPASLNPFMVKGLLRKELGYQGIVLTDWLDMGSIKSFVQKARESDSFPQHIKQLNLSDQGLAFVFCVYAGIDWPTGFSESSNRLDFDLRTSRHSTVSRLEKLYQTDSEFSNLFDNLAVESLLLKVKAMPMKDRPDFDFDVDKISLSDLSKPVDILPSDVRLQVEKLREFVLGKRADSGEVEGALSFAAKVQTLVMSVRGGLSLGRVGKTEFTLPNQIEKVISYYNRWSDVWNRSGIITMVFRKKFVEALTGKKFSGIPDSPAGIKNEIAWLDSLMSNKEFMAEYEKIDWDGEQMRSVFKAYLDENYGPLPSEIPAVPETLARGPFPPR